MCLLGHAAWQSWLLRGREPALLAAPEALDAQSHSHSSTCSMKVGKLLLQAHVWSLATGLAPCRHMAVDQLAQGDSRRELLVRQGSARHRGAPVCQQPSLDGTALERMAISRGHRVAHDLARDWAHKLRWQLCRLRLERSMAEELQRGRHKPSPQPRQKWCPDQQDSKLCCNAEEQEQHPKELTPERVQSLRFARLIRSR